MDIFFLLVFIALPSLVWITTMMRLKPSPQFLTISITSCPWRNLWKWALINNIEMQFWFTREFSCANGRKTRWYCGMAGLIADPSGSTFRDHGKCHFQSQVCNSLKKMGDSAQLWNDTQVLWAAEALSIEKISILRHQFNRAHSTRRAFLNPRPSPLNSEPHL